MFFFLCSDINECQEKIHNCHKMYGVCINIMPFFYCTCALGTKGNGTYCISKLICALLAVIFSNVTKH